MEIRLAADRAVENMCQRFAALYEEPPERAALLRERLTAFTREIEVMLSTPLDGLKTTIRLIEIDHKTTALAREIQAHPVLIRSLWKEMTALASKITYLGHHYQSASSKG
jgi:hypothetical protein